MGHMTNCLSVSSGCILLTPQIQAPCPSPRVSPEWPHSSNSSLMTEPAPLLLPSCLPLSTPLPPPHPKIPVGLPRHQRGGSGAGAPALEGARPEHLPAQWPASAVLGWVWQWVGRGLTGAALRCLLPTRPWCWVRGAGCGEGGWASSLSQAVREGWRELARSQAKRG